MQIREQKTTTTNEKIIKTKTIEKSINEHAAFARQLCLNWQMVYKCHQKWSFYGRTTTQLLVILFHFFFFHKTTLTANDTCAVWQINSKKLIKDRNNNTKAIKAKET